MISLSPRMLFFSLVCGKKCILMFTCLWIFYDGFCVPRELGVKGETTKNYKVKRKINKKKSFKTESLDLFN